MQENSEIFAVFLAYCIYRKQTKKRKGKNIEEIATDRWKILRMKPFQYGGFSNLDIQVSDEEFELLLCDKFVILKLVIVICLRRIIVEKERKI